MPGQGGWIQIVAGGFLLALGCFFYLVFMGRLLADAGVPGWYAAGAGAVLILLGLNWLVLGLWCAARGPLSVDAELVSNLFTVFLLLTLMAVMATYAALAAWIPELGGIFEEGITGSMIEHRIVWPIAAVVLDVLALVFGLALLGSVIAWVRGKARRR